jgi:poly(3-hydroxybutyrate) depolymerase
MKPKRFIVAAAVLACIAAPALPQALPNLALVRLSYMVRKRVVKPQGDLKQKVDANDQALAEAISKGQIGEVRRLIAKGMALLNGNDWTDVLDFANSLALRSDHTFVDSSRPYTVRIEQIYSPSIDLKGPLHTKVTLERPRAPQNGRGGNGGPAQPPEFVKDLGSHDDLSRDLRESPYLMRLDLFSVPDGSYQIKTEVFDGDRAIGSCTLRIVAQKGLDAALQKLEDEAARAPEAVKADVAYPLDYIRKVNLGLVDRGAFDVAKEIATAEETLAAAQGGKDPFAGRNGDFKRHYYLKTAGEIMPYRLYIPPSYDGARAYPMVLALHGLGGSEDSMFGPNYRALPEAEKRGYILVAPLGFRIDGGYGGRGGAPTRNQQLSEQDVMEVLRMLRERYKIDENRIYLLGHSMGAIGTWLLGPKYPELWAALAPIAGAGDPASVEKTRDIPEIVVHGDADNVVPVNSSRVMVAAMKKLGAEVKYIEVPGGGHGDVAAPNMSAIFDFFDSHRKAVKSTASTR